MRETELFKMFKEKELDSTIAGGSHNNIMKSEYNQGLQKALEVIEKELLGKE